MKRYFGTDGIRGRVGESPITPDFVLKLGWAAGRVLAEGRKGVVLIGKDTRISGYMFESVLEAGLTSAGVDVGLLGPMPTPAIAYLTRTLRARAGIVISASHNPYPDNGIKFFDSDGKKLPDEVEFAIEAALDVPLTTVESHELGKAHRVEDAAGRYIEFCKGTVPWGLSLKGLSIVLDCAHGATYHVAPQVFEELGARVSAIGVEPDGLNINEHSGATAPDRLRQTVLEGGADLGIAFDGDGDRVIMVDSDGSIVDGDELLFVIAEQRRLAGALNGAVVGTVMSNLGLEEALKRRGVHLLRAKVGDRHVLEMMQSKKCILGGETSGHIICLDRATTGDGIVSALQVLCAAVESGTSLKDLRKGMSKYPQVLINVRAARPKALAEDGEVRRAVEETEHELGSSGRVLLRPSGTEAVIRVMVEGIDASQVKGLAKQLAQRVSDLAAG
ncbi:MAG: phosphoglucosamine mutase [Betaproteobacteria bacterium]|nr:phosphoglucosamine mutase [Gammaproteobacteria bacterium]MDH3438372.1 phosphoglucosamine mutase [Betaproteobacteria bacterium]